MMCAVSICCTTSSSFVDAKPQALHCRNSLCGSEPADAERGVTLRRTDEGLSRKKYARSFSLYAWKSC